MTKPEKLIVPKDLGYWLDTRDIGNESLIFTLIEELREQVDEEFSGKTREFVFDYKKEIIEVLIGNRDYEVEEPLVYALVKGHELMGSNLKYWAIGVYQCGLSVLERYVDQILYSNKKTKSEWAEIGINDSNADFKEME